MRPTRPCAPELRKTQDAIVAGHRQKSSNSRCARLTARARAITKEQKDFGSSVGKESRLREIIFVETSTPKRLENHQGGISCGGERTARVENVILNGDKDGPGAHSGSIILSHDIHATTVDAMPDTFDKLLAKGFKFVTVSELIAMEKPLPPKATAGATTKPQGTPAAPAQ